jgi:nicotinamidase-related amidase
MPARRSRMTRSSTMVLLVDYQVGLSTVTRDVEVREMRRRVVGLTVSARRLELPVLATTMARDEMWGPTLSALKKTLGSAAILDRSTVNPWDFPPFADAVRAAGRMHLIIAGLRFEVGVCLSAISARNAGYQPMVAIDACGTFSMRERKAGIERLAALGIEAQDYSTLLAEVITDNSGSDPLVPHECSPQGGPVDVVGICNPRTCG